MLTKTVRLVTLQGDLDYEEHERVRTAMHSLEDATLAIVDLTDVTYMDSRSAALFFDLHQKMREGASLRLVTGDASMMKLLKISGIDRIADVFLSVQAAFNAH